MTRTNVLRAISRSFLLGKSARIVTVLPPICACCTRENAGNAPKIYTTAWPSRPLIANEVLQNRPGRFKGSTLFPFSYYLGLAMGVLSLPQLLRCDDNADVNDVDGNDQLGPTEEKYDMERVLAQAQKGVDERFHALKLGSSSLPRYRVSAKGQQVSVRFSVSPSCDVSHLIVDMVNRLGDKALGRGGNSEMIIQASNSTIARQLILSALENPPSKVLDHKYPVKPIDGEDEDKSSNNLCILMFEPLIGDTKIIEVEFLKRGFLTAKEMDAIISSLKIAGGVPDNEKLGKFRNGNFGESSAGVDHRQQKSSDRWSQSNRFRRTEAFNGQEKLKALETLETMGVKVYGVDTQVDDSLEGQNENSLKTDPWDNLVGYHEQKREIEDTILLALKRPEIYDSIARRTRRNYESNRPRAILLKDLPGVPLLYVPLEVVMSKYFGESERLLASIFHAGNEFPRGAILFLDEIDSLATARDPDMHEATRRLLSVLLRQMDGFERDSKVVVVAATNRKQDLDSALLSRFDCSILFGLPDLVTRQEIIAQYAQHLTSTERASVASVSDGMSGRDLHDICQQAERKWASKIIRELPDGPSSESLPPVQEYIDCAERRRQSNLYGLKDSFVLKHPFIQQ